MKIFKHLWVLVAVVSIFAGLLLSAMAQEPPPRKPPAVPQKSQAKPGPPTRPAAIGRPSPTGPAAIGRPVAPHPLGVARRFDPRHFDRHAWGRGRAYPYGCRWGRCGYWWWVDGSWYFYDRPFVEVPEEVSPFAYDEQGNLVPVAGDAPLPALPPPVVPYPATEDFSTFRH
jgi:hypothetical protein